MIESRDGRRVVVTGVGVVSPCGTGAEQFWAGLRCRRRRTRRWYGGVRDLDPDAWGPSYVESRWMERFARFGVAAAVQALVDAGLVAEMTSTGPLDEVDPDSPLDLVLEPRPRHPAAAISTSFGFGGHNGALVFVPAWRDI